MKSSRGAPQSMDDKELLKPPLRGTPDLEERDYHMINAHLVVEFEDIIGEPQGIHSHRNVWHGSYNCFNFCRGICYTLNTLCCSFCAVFCASSEIASAFFCHIWFGTPCLKAMTYYLRLPKRLIGDCVECMVVPCCQDASRHLKSFMDT